MSYNSTLLFPFLAILLLMLSSSGTQPSVGFVCKDTSCVNWSNLLWKRQFSTKVQKHQDKETSQNLTISFHEPMKA